MVTSESVLQLGGFVLAHAAWIVSDLTEGELLCPFALVEKGEERKLHHFEAETQEEAVRNGQAFVSGVQTDSEAWAFVREGLLNLEDRKVDVLSVDYWMKGMDKPRTIIQLFQPSGKEGRFMIFGRPILVMNGVIQEGPDVEAAQPIIFKGIQSHPKAAPLWAGWQK